MKKIMFLIVLLTMISCTEERMTSGEVFCSALIECEENNATISYEDCVLEYDSNYCEPETTSSCFHKFSDEEIDCLSKFSPCEFWTNYESCLKS